MGQFMSDLSKEQIEQKIRQLIEEEQITLEEISFDHLISATTSSGTDLMSLFAELGSLKTEMKQMNRLENKRLDALKDFLDHEKHSKGQLLEKIAKITRQNETLGLKSIVHSIIELRDFVEAFHRALPTVFKSGRDPFSLYKKRVLASREYVNENTDSILKKIDALLEKQGVFPTRTDNEPFDPALMTAVESTCDRTRADNQVVETLLKGYMFNDTVIRYAHVKVNIKQENEGEK